MIFKDETSKVRFNDMCELSQRIALNAATYIKEKYDIDIVLTATVSTKEEDKLLGRVSDTHRTRRAFDIRTGNLPDHVVADLIGYLNKNYGKFGAVVGSKPNLVVNKPHGTGSHLHIQLNRKYALKEIDYV